MQMSKDFLFEIYKNVKEKGIIDDDFIIFLDSLLPDNSDKVLEVVKRGITKYIFLPSKRTAWSVMGDGEREYMIYPRLFCSCHDFYNAVIIKRKRVFCKHILAQIICEALNKYEEEKLEDKQFKNFIKNLKLKF